MHNYALGLSLSKETGKSVCYDVSYFYNTKYKVAHEKDFLFENYNLSNTRRVLYDKSKIFDAMAFRLMLLFYKNVQIKKYTDYDPFLFDRVKKLGKTYIDVITLRFEYYDKYKDILRKEFNLKQQLDDKNQSLLEDIKKHKNSVSIHIRRGDYVYLYPYGGVVRIDNYYNQAFKIFTKMEDVHYYVFSNDIEWAKKNVITGKPTTFVNINDEVHGYFDSELIKNCKHNIISDSTFAWWAAYLNANPDKIVVAPHVASGKRAWLPVPEDWKIIENIPVVAVMSNYYY